MFSEAVNKYLLNLEIPHLVEACDVMDSSD